MSSDVLPWRCAQRRAEVLERAEHGALAVAGLEPGEAYDWLCPLGADGLAPFEHYTCPDGLAEAAREASLHWGAVPPYGRRAAYEQLGAVAVGSLDDGDEGDADVPPAVRAAMAAEPPDAPPPSVPPPPPGWRVVNGAEIDDAEFDEDLGLALLELETPTGPVRVMQVWSPVFMGSWAKGRAIGCGAGEVRLFEVEGEVWTAELVGDELSWGRWSVVDDPVPGQPP